MSNTGAPNPAVLSQWLQKLQNSGVVDPSTGAPISFSTIDTIFQKSGVPTYAWTSTLYAEDSSLSAQPGQAIIGGYPAVYDPASDGTPGYSFGLFQLRQPGVGSPYSPAQLDNPITNVQLTAGVMGSALKGVDTTNVSATMQAIERTWPGTPSPQRTSVAQIMAGILGADTSVVDATGAPAMPIQSGTAEVKQASAAVDSAKSALYDKTIGVATQALDAEVSKAKPYVIGNIFAILFVIGGLIWLAKSAGEATTKEVEQHPEIAAAVAA